MYYIEIWQENNLVWSPMKTDIVLRIELIIILRSIHCATNVKNCPKPDKNQTILNSFHLLLIREAGKPVFLEVGS